MRHALLGLLLALLTACGSSTTAPVAAPTPRATLPPNSVEELAAIFDPGLAELGVRLTRAGLVDRTDGNYTYRPDGTHLALYVEPIGAYSRADYARGVMTITEFFSTRIFDRWPGLESFDVCQEPHPDVDDSPEPRAETQVTLREDAAREIDWETFTLTDLLVLARSPDGPEDDLLSYPAIVVASAEVAEDPDYAKAREDARSIAVAD